MDETVESQTLTEVTTPDSPAVMKSEPQVITEQPSNDVDTSVKTLGYEYIYRTGNFGMTMGKFDQPLARKWCIANGVCILLIWILTVTGQILQAQKRERNSLDLIATIVPWLAALCGLLSEVLAVYFVLNMHRLNRPYGVLMTMRFAATFQFVFCLLGLFLVAIYVAVTNGAVQAVYSILIIVYAVNIVTSVSFVGMCAQCCDACSCCGRWCIYSEGEELAPGVPDPPSHENWYMCLAIAQGINTGLAKAEARGAF